MVVRENPNFIILILLIAVGNFLCLVFVFVFLTAKVRCTFVELFPAPQLFPPVDFKGTVMEIGKALKNDHLRVSKVSSKFLHSNY